MLTYVLPIRAQEILRLLQAEIATSDGQPELYYAAWEDYLIEEDFDRALFGITDGEAYSLVSVDAVLNIEPRLEQNYWVLRVIVHRDLGPRLIDDTQALIGATLTLEQFAEFVADQANTVTVRLDVTTRFAREHFNAWLDEQRAKHAVKLGTDQ